MTEKELQLDKINEEITNCPETVFDTFDIYFSPKLVGNALREKLVELSALYGRINQLATHAALAYDQAKNRRDVVEALAWEAVDSKMKVTEKKIAVKEIIVALDDKTQTTLNAEDGRVQLYKYIHDRGKDRVREISSLLDVGRTLLSWDKQEHGKVSY